MGRKGVSKRKPKQTKQSSTPVSGTIQVVVLLKMDARQKANPYR